MRKSRASVLAVSVFLILLLFFPLFAQSSDQEKPKVAQLGILAELTGWLGTWDTLQVKQAKMMADILNKAGGVKVGGRQYEIQLVVEDGKSSLDGVTAAANKLIFDHGIKFMIGPDAFFGSAVKAICEQNKILHILGWSTMQPGEMDASTKWAFLGQDCALETFLVGMSYLKEKHPNVKKVALFMPDDGSIPYLGPILKDLLKENGYMVVGDIVSYDNSAVDFNPIATRIVATKADAAIGVSGLALPNGSILKAIREAGSAMFVATCGGQDPNDILTVAGIGAASNYMNVGNYKEVPQQPPLLKEITRRVVAEMGKNVPLGLQFANPLYEYKQLFEKAQSFDPDVVRTTFDKAKTIDTLWGTGTLGGLRSYGIKHAVAHPTPVTTVENGKLVFQKWVTPPLVP